MEPTLILDMNPWNNVTAIKKDHRVMRAVMVLNAKTTFGCRELPKKRNQLAAICSRQTCQISRNNDDRISHHHIYVGGEFISVREEFRLCFTSDAIPATTKNAGAKDRL